MEQNKDDYTARISNASPLQLVVINFELIIDNIHDAVSAYEAGNTESFAKHINSARDFLNLLMTSLDMSYSLSSDLMRVYIYVNGLLIKSDVLNSTKPAREARKLLKVLLESFRSLADLGSNDEPVMENAQQIYAGLTYKDGKLSEYIMEETDRGFKA